jgi:hypothetical protein
MSEHDEEGLQPLLVWQQSVSQELAHRYFASIEALLERMLPVWDAKWRVDFGEPVVVFNDANELLGLGPGTEIGSIGLILVSARDHGG